MAYYVHASKVEGPFDSAAEAEEERRKHKRKYELYLQQNRVPGCTECEIQVSLCDGCRAILQPQEKKKRRKK